MPWKTDGRGAEVLRKGKGSVSAPASRQTRVTNNQLQDLLLDLAPLPQRVEELREELAQLRKDRQADREAAIRVEECLSAVKRSLDKMAGTIDAASRTVAETQHALAEMRARVDAVTRIVWALIIPVLLMIINVAVGLFTK